MYTIEFQAKIRNGKIEIPVQYREQLQETVKVIIQAEAPEPSYNLIDQLLEKPLEVKGFMPLSRESVYVRE